ncbi:MAG: BspA family leucine-rich repeat surface protein [Clostridiales bacterium]|nr:BspA family leucine-rich repeat surface protein [Clostridiales bacterium]
MENNTVINRAVSGSWGTTTWTLDEYGKLTINAGVGATFSSPEKVPWYQQREGIRNVEIDGKVSLNRGASLSYMFCDCVNLETVNLTGLSTYGVIGMNRMFYMCNSLGQVLFGDEFDTSRVANMSFMFAGCGSLEDIDVSKFNTSSVTDMSGIFSSCSNLKKIELSNFNISKVTSLLSMFMNCNALTAVDISNFDTKNVTDLSWMFCNCSSLEVVDLSNFNTSNVMDMSCMFLSCKKLEYLDISSFTLADNCKLQNMLMFCEKLRTLDLSNFGQDKMQEVREATDGIDKLVSLKLRSEAAEGEEAQDWLKKIFGSRDYAEDEFEKGVKVYYDPSAEFHVAYAAKLTEALAHRSTCEANATLDIEECDFAVPEGFAFKEWNTKKNGKGKSFEPRDKFNGVCSDVRLYAIWGAAPVLGALGIPEPLNYGDVLKLEPPRIIENNWEISSQGMEISPDGLTNWEKINSDTILPVAYNGYHVRYYASNSMGTTYSNSATLRINKAVYGVGEISWDDEDFVYNGTEKKIHIKNLPAGAIVNYKGCSAVKAGVYSASAIITPEDRGNFIPLIIDEYRWEIKKARYDMSQVKWDYEEAFTYNEEEKSVLLMNLPEGVTAQYRDNKATEAGKYRAVAELTYDHENHEEISVEDCTWEIRKAQYDMSAVKWQYSNDFLYDGTIKAIYLEGLPQGVTAQYEDNRATDAGSYVARAILTTDMPDDFETPTVESFSWEIRKAHYNMDSVRWSYDSPFVYSGSEKFISLEGLPDGVIATYSDNSKTYAGKYTAKAVLESRDPSNYEAPTVEQCEWTIKKARYDMSSVKWSHTEPLVYNGEDQTIYILNLPEGITAHYEGNIAKDVGLYNAGAEFSYDEENYERPTIRGCQWKISKASYDMSIVSWDKDEDFVYNGTSKTVQLRNLPEGITARYEGNNAVNAGRYTAKAILEVADPDNYKIPIVNSYLWEISKAEYDVQDAYWDYKEPFTYNGEEKSVEIKGLPSGVAASYNSNKMINAGNYMATAVLNVDTRNYETPVMEPCEWVIKKAFISMDGASWNYTRSFVYDGSEKDIELTGLPEGVIAYYTDNRKTNAGVYTAEANLSVYDERNFHVGGVESCTWEISKATYDISKVQWVYNNDFIYDGKEKSVVLKGLPAGVTAYYTGNKATDAGTYQAKAELINDTQNYEIPEVEPCTWEIGKADKDLSKAKWSYNEAFVYDGSEKGIHLIDLPPGVRTVYTGNSAVTAGSYHAEVTIFAKDERNFNVGTVEGCTWEISKADYNLSGAKWVHDESAKYDGSEKSVYLADLPVGIVASYKSNTGIEAGSYTAEAFFSYDSDNYNKPTIDDFVWQIRKAQYDMSNVKWDYAEPFVYDGEEKRIALESIQEEVKHFLTKKKTIIIKGLPEGVHVTYTGNAGINAGIYIASATCTIDDVKNY